MAEQAVRSCNCDHEFQDKTYGTGKRVFNKIKPVNTTGSAWRCTVCGAIQTTGDTHERDATPPTE